jgi:hypothetical protein
MLYEVQETARLQGPIYHIAQSRELCLTNVALTKSDFLGPLIR